MKRETMKTFAIIILLLVLSFFLLNLYKVKIENKAFSSGFNEGITSIVMEVQTGKIPVVSTSNNQTTVEWYPINDVCGGIKNG